jgi:hypothetical protein
VTPVLLLSHSTYYHTTATTTPPLLPHSRYCHTPFFVRLTLLPLSLCCHTQQSATHPPLRHFLPAILPRQSHYISLLSHSTTSTTTVHLWSPFLYGEIPSSRHHAELSVTSLHFTRIVCTVCTDMSILMILDILQELSEPRYIWNKKFLVSISQTCSIPDFQVGMYSLSINKDIV